MSLMLGLLIFLVASGFFFYLFLMIFYPEWVGITGKTAQKNLNEHEEGSPSEEMAFVKDLMKEDFHVSKSDDEQLNN